MNSNYLEGHLKLLLDSIPSFYEFNYLLLLMYGNNAYRLGSSASAFSCKSCVIILSNVILTVRKLAERAFL